MAPKEYKSKTISYRVTLDFRNQFINACKENGHTASKLRRKWALNFLKGLNPDGSQKMFKIISFENQNSGKIFSQVYFKTVAEKTSFIEYCDKESISQSDFFRTCEYNYIKTGNPNGD